MTDVVLLLNDSGRWALHFRYGLGKLSDVPLKVFGRSKPADALVTRSIEKHGFSEYEVLDR